MGNNDDTLQSIARWSGCVGSLFTAVVGIVHVCSGEANVRWPGTHDCSSEFINDECNLKHWRAAKFSFAPTVFVDVWTPLVFGLFGLLIHVDKFRCPRVTNSFATYLIFNVISALWATMGYEGGLGILFSIPIWISVLFCLICAIRCDGDAFIGLENKIRR